MVDLSSWRHGPQVQVASQQTGVPAAVIEAIMMTEGSGDTARSPAGAMGPMQVMPFHFTAGQNPWDIQTNITVGAQVLASNFQRFGNWTSAAAAYFGAVDSHGNPTGGTDAGGMTGTGYAARFNAFLTQLGGAGTVTDNTSSLPTQTDTTTSTDTTTQPTATAGSNPSQPTSMNLSFADSIQHSIIQVLLVLVGIALLLGGIYLIGSKA